MELALVRDKLPHSHSPAASEGADDLISFREMLAVLQRHKRLILFCVIAAMIAGTIYIMFSAPRFTTTTSILIDPRQNSALPKMLSASDSFQENLVIDSQIEVIKSSSLLEKAAKKSGIYDTLPTQTTGPLSWIRSLVSGPANPAQDTLADERAKQAKLSAFSSGLSVNRVRNTYVIAIDYTSGDPQQAAKMANLIADTYLDDELEAKYEASQRASEWLKSRLSVLEEELTSTESEVETYKEENDIVQTDNRNFISDQQLSELNSSLIVSRAESAQAKARYENIQTIIESGNPETATTDVMTNSVIVGLRGKYLDLSRTATDILRREGKDHLAYRNLLQQMQDIQNLIWSEYRRVAESYKNEYEIAKSKEVTLSQELENVKGYSAATSKNQIGLRALQRQADSTRNLYTKMLDKSNEEIERQSLPNVNARVISYAMPPLVPSWPNKRLVILMSLFVGLGVGVGLAFLREQFERFIWKAEDLEAASHRTCLGMLPKIAFDRDKIGHLSKRWSTKDLSVTELPSSEFNSTGFAEVTQMLEKQTGVITEIMRNVQLATHFNKEDALAEKSAKVISFVSARPGEGKSITSCFLAKHLARSGARVALIDCDFRRPSLTHWFMPGAKSGFYELASRVGKSTPREIVADIVSICNKTGQDNLFFIPAKGANTSIANLNLVASGQMNELIVYLRQIFDVILIDLPPIMNIVDARMIANSIDSFVLLAHWGKTDRGVVSKALHRAPEVYAKTVGTLLTLVDTEKASRYGYYNYNYYYYYSSQAS